MKAPFKDLIERLITPLCLLLGTSLVGTFGFWLIGSGLAMARAVGLMSCIRP